MWNKREVSCGECDWKGQTDEIGPMEFIARQTPVVVHGTYSEVEDVTKTSGTKTVLMSPDGRELRDLWGDGHAVEWTYNNEGALS